ncbi:hypothetical protein JDV02_006674 [Purpureocillium takamizusanense]|uniref:Up-regulated during septation protein 1 domain-containing protein n=1 Tax=Purpureocillium takamizusanense TaxID=2060973 RepID=A0A9Q8QIU3_9HYPO|nr:uncharacterized protein JDV02_006674 [Purpureocillium takamizusanense]UNI20603.1 hypothetical protein JDV02_006674 [Purpureocillium takamizusanense]
MAHIASCIAGIEPATLSKPGSPAPQNVPSTPSTSTSDRPFAWRMLQPDSQRKYQLFPKRKQLPQLESGQTVAPEKAFAIAMGQTVDGSEKPTGGSNLRLRINQHPLVRRRKVSVPELGPMTTVQETSMDSPTIPGRPPLHERSVSAPEEATKPKRAMTTTPFSVTDEDDEDDFFAKIIEEAFTPVTGSARAVSPKRLAPLVIPASTAPVPLLQSRTPAGTVRSDSTPPLNSSRSARLDVSPLSRARVTPSASTPDLTFSRSATTDATSASTLPTPVSAPLAGTHRASPRPWEGSAAGERGTTQAEDGARKAVGHRRGASESSGIMDRGRARKRVEVRNNNGPLLKGSEAKQGKSCERRAFEELPKGFKPAEATSRLNANEVATLQKQAYGQAERFEVLKTDDVEALSKELRHLDERTEYLRRTYTSLRAGRRNLHTRICQYLRSPRVARFSHESMLKQEEALAELDASIDDWVTKLEHAENRRTRVRQKLLEHVAAATILPSQARQATANDSPQQGHILKSPPPRDISTPPRSPSKHTFATRSGSCSPSPQRVVAQVPSTIHEQPVVEEAAEQEKSSRAISTVTMGRGTVESIRIYAGDDVYALLADVENEISKMSSGVGEQTGNNKSHPARTEHERQKSHEKLSGECSSPATTRCQDPASGPTASVTGNPPIDTATPISPPAPTPPKKDDRADKKMMLTSAVFKP